MSPEPFVTMTGGPVPDGLAHVVLDPDDLGAITFEVNRLPPIVDGPRVVAHGPQAATNAPDDP